MDIVDLLILIIILTMVNNFFVRCKYSIIKIDLEELKRIIHDNKSKLERCRQIKEKTDKFLSVCQLGGVIALLIIGYLTNEILNLIYLNFEQGEALIQRLTLVGVMVSIVLFEAVFGFFIPRFIAIRQPQMTLVKNSFLLRFVYVFLRPIAAICDFISDNLVKLIIRKKSDDDNEIRNTAIAISVEEQNSEKTDYDKKRELMDNIFSFEEKQIREVLVPRTDMICIDLEDEEDYIFNLIREEGYTRYPVCGKSKDKDDLLGFIHIRDLYNQKLLENKVDISKILRKITYVSENELTSKVLEKLRKNRVQMAIVVDEYGGTSGMITVEDILEEIVGEIQDEFDEDEVLEIKKINETSYIVQGTTTILDINKLLDVEIEKEGFDSLGGWIFYMLGMDIEEGQSFEFEGYRFIVLELDKFRIVNVKIEKLIEEIREDL